MSVEAVLSRISQIEAMMNGGAAQAAAPVATAATTSDLTSASNGASFAGALASATGTGGADASASTLAAPAAGASALPAGTPFAAQITASAKRNGIDPALLAGLIKQESGFNPHAGSAAGAQGLTQLMPGTARGLGVTNTFDPAQSIEGGARYLKQQLDHFGGDVARALAAYNAGPGAVQRYGGVPPYAETQNYVRRVQAYAAAFRSSSTHA
jgi:soluble lytic murein transglycosylase-like protein